ncbi:MAG: DbpA RNA binding domain-containing protein, partial [Planctomycetota bacterium]
AVANEAGIESEFIGPIKIYPHFSTIDLPEGMPKDVFQTLQRTWVSGKQLRIRPDRGPGQRDSGRRGSDQSGGAPGRTGTGQRGSGKRRSSHRSSEERSTGRGGSHGGGKDGERSGVRAKARRGATAGKKRFGKPKKR